MFTLVNLFSHLYHRIYRLIRCRRPKQKSKQQASFPFQRHPPGSPITEPPQGELTSTCAFGFCAYSWSSSPSNHQGALLSTTRQVWNPKFFILPGVDWCVTTVNSLLTRRRVPKALLPFFCPTSRP